jgi:cobalt-zinc-cadmium efflux system protein
MTNRTRKSLELDDNTDSDVAEIFRALSDTSRIKLMATLVGGEQMSALARAALRTAYRTMRHVNCAVLARGGQSSIPLQHIIDLFCAAWRTCKWRPTWLRLAHPCRQRSPDGAALFPHGFVDRGGAGSSPSLALLTDAAHNLTDVIALALSWYAIRLTLRPANSGKTYGYHRAGILIALFNSTTLVLIALGIFYEAYQRLLHPPEVEGGLMTVVAALAFIVNLGTALLVKPGSADDLNQRSAFIHLAGDALSTLGALIAGVLIMLTGWTILDPLASVFIGLLIVWNAWLIIRESAEILLEGTPRDIDVEAMVNDITRMHGVRGVHDLHVWSITQNMRALSAHVLVDDEPISVGAGIQRQINAVLQQRYHITHATLQLECVGCEPDMLYCELNSINHG